MTLVVTFVHVDIVRVGEINSKLERNCKMELPMNQDDIFYAKRHDSPFPSIIYCPQCDCHWHKRFVPEYCPECGAKVTNTPGTGYNEDSALIEKGKLGIKILQCPKCKLRYPELVIRRSNRCQRCNTSLTNATPVKNFVNKIIFHWRCLRYKWRNMR